MSNNNKQTSPKIVSLASNTLHASNASKVAKSLAASLISQTNTSKQTGAELESVASKVLQSPKYSDDTKSLAASVLAQSNKER